MPYHPRVERLMDAPIMGDAFTQPHDSTPPPKFVLPVPFVIAPITYEEAYEQADIACWEIMGTPHGGRDWEDLHDKLLDALCIKHNINT